MRDAPARLIALAAALSLVLVACEAPTATSTPTAFATASVSHTVTSTVTPPPTAPATATPTAPSTSTSPPQATPPLIPAPTATPRIEAPSVTPPPLDPSRRRELAPIESLTIRIAESSPPQVFVDVATGLPGGCAAFDYTAIQRSGTTISLTMWNTMPSGCVACTAIYGYLPHTIALGAFPPGTYTLRVNDQTRTFTTQ